MTRRILFAVAVAAVAIGPAEALAAGGEAYVEDHSFSFEGPFGTFDRLQLQRGYQVFAEVCSACHGMKYLSFRSLGDANGPGFPDEQVKAIAAEYFCVDRDPAVGERECRPSDRFPANTGVGAPDLSLMAKARAGFHGPMGLGLNQLMRGTGGAEYIASLLLGYTGEEEEMAGSVLYENTAFPGGLISMAPPLFEGSLEYALYDASGQPITDDGEGEHHAEAPEATVEQMAKDVAAFLMWAAEPTMVERKEAGLRNIVLLVILSVLLYYTNKKLWAPIKRKPE